jgi:hypothetical protein
MLFPSGILMDAAFGRCLGIDDVLAKALTKSLRKYRRPTTSPNQAAFG